MKKKQYTGYVGLSQREAAEKGILSWVDNKSSGAKVLLQDNPADALVFKTKGKEEDWDQEDWPPLKISIIVTVEETE
jgi:hypothetical protein